MKKRMKKAYICANINEYTIDESCIHSYVPVAGDVAIFEVLSIGKHKQIQGAGGRMLLLMPGDIVMAAFGTRYATSQFEGYLPQTCAQEFDILGAGGTIGVVKSMHVKFNQTGTTRLRIIGYAVKDGVVVNTIQQKAELVKRFEGTIPAKVILSVGSSMDSGKTTTAAHLVYGLKAMNKKVAFVKLTGTVYTKDIDMVYDMGADMVADFSDFGYPSTFLCKETELLDLYASLIHTVQSIAPDYIVVEIADGLYQRETAMLLRNPLFAQSVYGTVFSAGDSLSAVNGYQVLRAWGVLPFAISGLFTASPLMIEEVRSQLDTPVFTLLDLQNINSYQIKTVNVLSAA